MPKIPDAPVPSAETIAAVPQQVQIEQPHAEPVTYPTETWRREAKNSQERSKKLRASKRRRRLDRLDLIAVALMVLIACVIAFLVLWVTGVIL